MQKSDILLTNQELAMAISPLYPSTKYAIFRKLEKQFQVLGERLQQADNKGTTTSFKLTRGENYREMPYMNLDYPRITGSNFSCVHRIMFWWGHYISSNLIISRERIHPVPTDLESPAYCLWSDAPWENDVTIGYTNTRRVDINGHHEQYIRITRTVAIDRMDQLEEMAIAMQQELQCLMINK